MEKYCPKCNAIFICKVDDIENCACNAIKLSPEAAAIISQTYGDCVCVDCLLVINEAGHRNTDGTD